MTTLSYRLPGGAVPVLLSADAPDLVQADAAALLSYVAANPEKTPQAVADMLFRTRLARRFRAVAMAADRDGLIAALTALADGDEHPGVVRSDRPAAPGRVGFVFPGQGGQRPGMGRLFYDTLPAFRTEVDRCADAFEQEFGASPLPYLLDEQALVDDRADTVQPALFTHMAGLAAIWRSFGIAPAATVGHSQGEIAAAYVAGRVTLADAVRVVGIRARAADEFTRGDYAMAVIATGRDECEGLLARCDGWAQVSVVNSASIVGISGDGAAVRSIVDSLAERGVFARTIGVRYPAHTTRITEIGDRVRADLQRRLQNRHFLASEIDCIGSTFGAPLTEDTEVDRYWFFNMRNTVRFDRAINSAAQHGITTFIELADHPTLQLAIRETLDSAADDSPAVVVGTSHRTADGLNEFTRNLLRVAVHDAEFDWQRLAVAIDGPAPLPLRDFPNSAMRDFRSWLPYSDTSNRRPPPAPAPASPEPKIAARLLTEDWVRLSQRSLTAPRSIGIVDHTGACAELAAALCAAAEDIGATARLLGAESVSETAGLDTQVILCPQSPALDGPAAAAAVADFFGDHTWWTGLPDGVTECWLVTVGGEVVAGDPPPDPVAAGVAAGFRSVGAEHPGVRFRHLDLAAGSVSPDDGLAVISALHTADESELALRHGGLYAKRVLEIEAAPQQDSAAPQHVLITGGTGKLGLEFCEHFARRGARRITLVSRSGETNAVADRLRELRSTTSSDIRVCRCDIADEVSVSVLAQDNRDTPADVVVHAAVQYSGAELADLTVDMVEHALRAKVVGLSPLLNDFARTADCRVLLCSSVAANVGGRGLIAYAAANRMLDAMAHRLRADGLNCVAVQWGQWSVTFDPDAASTEKLGVTGLVPMAPDDALALGLSRLPGDAIAAAIDLDRARLVLDTCGRASLLAALEPPTATPAPTAAARDDSGDVSQRFLTLLAGTIGVDGVDAIDTTVPMVAIGLDSLQALEFRRRVKVEFDHELEVADLLGGASISDVLARLQARSRLKPPRGKRPP